MIEPRPSGGPITLLHAFSTFAVGGPQTRFATIADQLGRKYRHLIVSMSGRTEAAKLLSARVDFKLVPATNIPGNPPANVLRFGRAIRELEPDALVTYNWGALEWAIGNRFIGHAAHIHIEDGFGPDEAVRRLRRRIWMRRIGLRRTRAVIVPSRNLERIALGEWKLPRAQVQYLPNGVEISRFQAFIPASERAFVKRPGEIIVGTCAALRAEKNLGRLIRAFAACDAQTARLVICGDGSERRGLEAVVAAAGLGDRVVFTGYLSRPELALAGFDIFAMSSDTEQMPYGLLEAMAGGLPAVSTDVGDIAAMVAPSNRPYVTALGDDPALASALAALLADPALRALLGADNRAKAEREYALTQMIGAYDRLFEETARSG